MTFMQIITSAPILAYNDLKRWFGKSKQTPPEGIQQELDFDKEEVIWDSEDSDDHEEESHF